MSRKEHALGTGGRTACTGLEVTKVALLYQIPNVLAFGNKRATVRYPIVCKMRYTELTGIDNDYEEIGIGALETVRDAEAQRDEEITNEVQFQRCG